MSDKVVELGYAASAAMNDPPAFKKHFKALQKQGRCIPDVNVEFVAAMEEEVLELYEAPYDPMRPVVCFDFRESVFSEGVLNFV
ncbi:hypothetical protein [Candidatus Methylobacter oryzae]|uniref:Uncharacterized protein n=1 Tax=Candidatus Methylobacter oryzae TaxID=2497749 RepID=A0ABY3C7L3_9GAMM|nr:hypothetical protein [Candidatus Methylobacter oryzae]TRW91330.1 hypothetical protein EKO24_017300 [Candidatus Methylobacter oryzae]